MVRVLSVLEILFTFLIYSFKPRICGLTNPDYTKSCCFMNSVLQCLTHTTPLREYFSVSLKYIIVQCSSHFCLIQEVINCDGLLGKLAEAFAFFLCDMCNGSEEVVQPEYLKVSCQFCNT